LRSHLADERVNFSGRRRRGSTIAPPTHTKNSLLLRARVAVAVEGEDVEEVIGVVGH